MAYKIGSLVWTYGNMLNDMNSCLNGDPKSRNHQGRGSYDPNEMIGPWGYDEQRHFIKPIHEMGYTITFENKASATAPAHEVFVTDTLDLTKFDAETFSFTSYGWADTALVVGGSFVKEFTRDVMYNIKGKDILVRVSGQFDPQTGIAQWAFVSLQKNGDEIDDPDLGFLVPNNDNRDGEGFVNFIIEHKKNPANGSTVSNKATIVFDANAPITTNTYVNTFDTDYPTSKITKVEEKNGQLVISLQGSDATSGIDHYTIYAFLNDSEEAEIFVPRVTANQVTVPCKPGTKYGICSIATDHVGWNEAKNLKVEANITTSGEAPGPDEKTMNVNVSAEGYATFYDSQDNYELPLGLTARVVTDADSRLRSQTLSGSIVPKGVAVYLTAQEKKAATYTLTATKKEASYTGSNLLHGSDESAMTTTPNEDDYLFYKLAYGPSGTTFQDTFGWFWGGTNGRPFRIEGHRAWLAVPRGSGTRGYILEGEETSISSAVNDDEVGSHLLYDLQGRPVGNKPKKGLYIRDDKKILIK